MILIILIILMISTNIRSENSSPEQIGQAVSHRCRVAFDASPAPRHSDHGWAGQRGLFAARNAVSVLLALADPTAPIASADSLHRLTGFQKPSWVLASVSQGTRDPDLLGT